MTSTVILSDNGASSGSAGIKTTGGNDGVLVLQTTTSGGTATNALYIDTAQNVGVGVTPSAWNSGDKAIELAGGALDSVSVVDLRIYQNGYNTAGGSVYKTSNPASLYRQSNASHIWYNAPSGTAGSAITFTQAMTLDASGNLGVGATSVNSMLHLRRDTSSGVATSYPNIRLDNPNASGYTGLYFYADTTQKAGFEVSNSAGALQMLVANAERARIDSSGNLLVGQTSRGNVNSLSFDLDVATGTFYSSHNSGSSSGLAYSAFGYNGTTIGSITQNGTTGVLYNTSSDYRLKDITGPVTGEEAKTFIMALQPKQGSWKSDGSKFVGFVAHEFQEVSPSSVSGEKDAVDEDGKPIMQSMQASSPEVMANLVALIQEQQAIIVQLQADVAALKGRA